MNPGPPSLKPSLSGHQSWREGPARVSGPLPCLLQLQRLSVQTAPQRAKFNVLVGARASGARSGAKCSWEEKGPPPPIGAELGGVPSPLLQQPARVPGKEAGDMSRRNHPFSLAMATFVGLQPQPGLRLSPATRRLGDLHKPQASALPPASQEGCSIRGAPRVSLALSVSKPLAPALSHSPEISRDGVALGGRRTNLHSLSDGGRGRAPSVPRTNGWKSGACHWLELSK